VQISLKTHVHIALKMVTFFINNTIKIRRISVESNKSANPIGALIATCRPKTRTTDQGSTGTCWRWKDNGEIKFQANSQHSNTTLQWLSLPRLQPLVSLTQFQVAYKRLECKALSGSCNDSSLQEKEAVPVLFRPGPFKKTHNGNCWEPSLRLYFLC